ncbi:hypothetical protein [Listeria fleischmannii]|nr:hypothetical protein [Listeria fleischmannii]
MQTSFKDGDLEIIVTVKGVNEKNSSRARRLIIAVHEALTKNIK